MWLSIAGPQVWTRLGLTMTHNSGTLVWTNVYFLHNKSICIFRSNIVYLKIYYESLMTTVTEQVAAYTFAAFSGKAPVTHVHSGKATISLFVIQANNWSHVSIEVGPGLTSTCPSESPEHYLIQVKPQSHISIELKQRFHFNIFM